MHHLSDIMALLAAQGVPILPSTVVRSREEAAAGVAANGRQRPLPVDVCPADPFPIRAFRRVEYAADLPLAYEQARVASATGAVRIRQATVGPVRYLDGFVRRGVFVLSAVYGITRHERFQVDSELWGPLDPDETLVAGGLATVSFAVPDAPLLLEAVCLGATWVIADAVSASLSEYAPAELCAEPGMGGFAVCWLKTHSGIVDAVQGVDEARALPGVTAVAVHAKPGDTIRHIVDRESRDRVGYAAAAGATPHEALMAARAARDCCEIVTRKTIE